jgi:hypothetical protein
LRSSLFVERKVNPRGTHCGDFLFSGFGKCCLKGLACTFGETSQEAENLMKHQSIALRHWQQKTATLLVEASSPTHSQQLHPRRDASGSG